MKNETISTTTARTLQYEDWNKALKVLDLRRLELTVQEEQIILSIANRVQP